MRKDPKHTSNTTIIKKIIMDQKGMYAILLAGDIAFGITLQEGYFKVIERSNQVGEYTSAIIVLPEGKSGGPEAVSFNFYLGTSKGILKYGKFMSNEAITPIQTLHEFKLNDSQSSSINGLALLYFESSKSLLLSVGRQILLL